MSQDLIKDQTSEREWNSTKNEISQSLTKFGWKWAVLASTVNTIYKKGGDVPTDLLSKIRVSRTQIESGCYSVCDISSELQNIERELFQELVNSESHDPNNFLDLIGKAMNGTIKEKEVDFSGPDPILADCLSLPCICN